MSDIPQVLPESQEAREQSGTAAAHAQPASALPWGIQTLRQTTWQQLGTRIWADSGAELVGKTADERDAIYIVHACNNYPRLIAALLTVHEIEEGDGHTDRPQWAAVRKLLRDLGELSTETK